jgi:L-alanine-DL-glutamate epimerase-like enolase superfamily enzyme
MRIAKIDVFGLALTNAHGTFELSGGRALDAADSTLVRITSDTGLEGWGESCPLTGAYLPAFTGGIRAALDEIAPRLIGVDPRNLAAVTARMDGALRGQAAAKCPLDVACWDILGRFAGLPLTTLLGGLVREDLPLYEAIPIGSVEQTEERVRASLARGFRRFQLKVGGDPRADVVVVRRVVEQVGVGALVIVDANGGWRLDDALVAARGLADLPIYLEQPCPTLEACARVQGVTGLPMIYDEVVVDAESLVAAVRDGGASVVNLKLTKVGGLTHLRVLRDLAASLGVRVMLEDSWGGDIASAAISHIAASAPAGALLATTFVNDATREHIGGHQPRSSNGQGNVPAGAGLGIDVELELLGTPTATYA